MPAHHRILTLTFSHLGTCELTWLLCTAALQTNPPSPTRHLALVTPEESELPTLQMGLDAFEAGVFDSAHLDAARSRLHADFRKEQARSPAG